MAPPVDTPTLAAGPSTSGGRNRTAEALHAWCRNNYEPGYVFSQDELLGADIIPNRDIQILLSSVQHLVAGSLFKLHDRAGGTIGWELVDQEKAQNYSGLTRDERLVLQCVDDAKTSGIWTRTIKMKTSFHARVLDRVYKSLEVKGLIKSMKHVNHPNRKMYILSGLDPSEEATGGSWFSEGHLDVGLVDTISKVIEVYVSNKSWQMVEEEGVEEQAHSPGQKRKAPASGFEEREDRGKAAKGNDGQHKGKGAKAVPQKSYLPFNAGHKSYPTLRDITRHILDIKVTATILPQNAILQLVQVLVYDDRLFKMHRTPNDDELPDDPINNTITMYRCFKNPTDLYEQHQLGKRKDSHHDSVRKAAFRQQELEDIGPGGASEVPCLRCPAFDICGDGGLVNANTCKYFDQWYVQLAEAETESPTLRHGTKDRSKNKHKDREKESEKHKDKENDQATVTNGEPGPTVDVELESS